MGSSERFNQRVLAIGREIFELADAAQPNWLDKSWWLEQATHVVEQDEQLKTRAFTFVDCLPALRSHAEITRHVSEYLGPAHVDLPPMFPRTHSFVPGERCRNSAAMRSSRRGCIASL